MPQTDPTRLCETCKQPFVPRRDDRANRFCSRRCCLRQDAMTQLGRWVHRTDYCWEWIGLKNETGYGTLTVRQQRWLAHRLSWTLHRGPIPNGLCVLHKCDFPPCVNPDHLFLGTRTDNHADMIRKGRNK